jgi:hypothetical protein
MNTKRFAAVQGNPAGSGAFLNVRIHPLRE